MQDFFDLKSFSCKELFDEKATLWSPLLKLSTFFASYDLGRIESVIPKSVEIEDIKQVSIGKNVAIEPGVFIKGPCIIGDGCHLRKGAYLRGFVLAGKNCVIGHTTEIKSSILLDGVKAAHFAYIGDSILGNGVNLGAGVKCANFRLDQKEIFIHFGEKKEFTTMNKLGAILGDHVQIGCNTVLNPGTLIAKGSICYPLLNPKGVYKPHSTITV